jgi:hypothetical protein
VILQVRVEAKGIVERAAADIQRAIEHSHSKDHG